MVRDDLRQEVLARKISRGEIVELPFRLGMRIGPPPERQTGNMLANQVAQFPCVRHTPWRPDRAVTAEHHQGSKPFVPGALRVRQTELERVLGREERYDMVA